MSRRCAPMRRYKGSGLNSSHLKPAFCDCKVLRVHVVCCRYQTGRTEDAAVLVVHMTPESVLNTDQYRSWMERFGSTTRAALPRQLMIS